MRRALSAAGRSNGSPENVAVRLLCADRHPDHDSICAFRRGNQELLSGSFHQVLEAAARIKVLRVGDVTLSMDGTKILASASRFDKLKALSLPKGKHSAVSHGHAQAQMPLLEEQIAQLLAKAEQADSAPLDDGLSVPAEVARRRDRLEKLREATAQIQARAKERHREPFRQAQGPEPAEGEMAAFEQKQARRAEQRAAGKKPRGREPKPPVEGPRSKDQYNFTDPESRIMKSGSGFEQSCNAQAAVEVGSRLIPSASLRAGSREAVSDAPNDKEQMEPGVAAVSPVIESIAAVLVDSGFYSEKAVAAVESGGGAKPSLRVYAATGRQPHGRSIEQLEKRGDPPEPGPGASAAEVMQHRLCTKAGRALYALRKQTVEPVFGIIPSASSGPRGKAAMGFRRFSLRGLQKVRTEWTLVTLSHNLKRLFHPGARLQAA